MQDRDTSSAEARKCFNIGTSDAARVEPQPTGLTLEAICGSVPPLLGRETIDVEDQIEEAMEEEAERIVQRMGSL